MIQILTVILCYDIWFYISHLLLHTKILYKYHKEHHVLYPTFLDTYRGHLIESPFQGLGIFIPYLWTTVSLQNLAISLVIINIKGMMRHDPRTSFIIGDHHLLHHRFPNYNYGEPWLDTLFATGINQRQLQD